MSDKPRAMRDALLARIADAMADQDELFFVTADFGSPVLDRIREEHPDRFLNVGIAEQNLINVSAGLSLEGYTVFAYAIAPFITMRCYEQIRISLAILSQVREMNVNLIGVGAGFSYVVSGPTHQCFEDLTAMRALPNMQVYSPADDLAAAALFDQCVASSGPKYLRLDAQPLPRVSAAAPTAQEFAKGFRTLLAGDDICLLATGYMVQTALDVARRLAEQGLKVSVLDVFNVSGFDRLALIEHCSRHRGLVSLEEGFSGRGGLDAALFDSLNQAGLRRPLLNIGVDGPHRFELGTRAELHESVGIGPDAVSERIGTFWAAAQADE